MTAAASWSVFLAVAFAFVAGGLGLAFWALLSGRKTERMDQRWLERKWLEHAAPDGEPQPLTAVVGSFPADSGSGGRVTPGLPELYDQDEEFRW